MPPTLGGLIKPHCPEEAKQRCQTPSRCPHTQIPAVRPAFPGVPSFSHSGCETEGGTAGGKERVKEAASSFVPPPEPLRDRGHGPASARAPPAAAPAPPAAASPCPPPSPPPCASRPPLLLLLLSFLLLAAAAAARAPRLRPRCPRAAARMSCAPAPPRRRRPRRPAAPHAGESGRERPRRHVGPRRQRRGRAAGAGGASAAPAAGRWRSVPPSSPGGRGRAAAGAGAARGNAALASEQRGAAEGRAVLVGPIPGTGGRIPAVG